MARIKIEGFDKYGPAGTLLIAGVTIATVLTNTGEWTSMVGSPQAVSIVAGLSATGQALQVTGASSGAGMGGPFATLPGGNYARIIGGVWVSSTLANLTGIALYDGATAQFSIVINTNGTIGLRSGTSAGTLLATSASAVSANSTNNIEYDVTIGASGAAYQVWLNGVSVISGTGATRGGTAANQVNGVQVWGQGSSTVPGVAIFDNLYLNDTTGSVNNAVLLDNSVVETSFPASDSAVQFAVGAAIVGSLAQSTASLSAQGAGALLLRRVTPSRSCTLNSVSAVCNTTSAAANLKAVAYADSAGAPGSLLSSGTQITGTVAGTAFTGALVTPQALTGGTAYWIGFIGDTNLTWYESDGTSSGLAKANTYASGAPATGSGMGNTVTFLFWGNVSSITGGSNTIEVNGNYSAGDFSYVFDATVSDVDLYNFNALNSTPQTIHTVALKIACKLAASGARTVDLDIKSSGTISAGSSAGQTPSLSGGILTSFFDTDPATGLAWTASGLNAATGGPKVAS